MPFHVYIWIDYGKKMILIAFLISDRSSKQTFTAHIKTCDISSEFIWKRLHQEKEQMVSVLYSSILYTTHVQALRWLGYVTSTPLSLASYNNFTSTFDINPLILYFRLAKIKEWVDNNDSGAVIIPLSGALEYKVTQITKISVEFHSLLSQCSNKIPIVISLALKLCWLFGICADHMLKGEVKFRNRKICFFAAIKGYFGIY